MTRFILSVITGIVLGTVGFVTTKDEGASTPWGLTGTGAFGTMFFANRSVLEKSQQQLALKVRSSTLDFISLREANELAGDCQKLANKNWFRTFTLVSFSASATYTGLSMCSDRISIDDLQRRERGKKPPTNSTSNFKQESILDHHESTVAAPLSEVCRSPQFAKLWRQMKTQPEKSHSSAQQAIQSRMKSKCRVHSSTNPHKQAVRSHKCPVLQSLQLWRQMRVQTVSGI